MAVRFDASSDRYVATISGGAQTIYTFCCWVKITTNRTTWVTAVNLNNGTTGNSATFETNSNGNTWEALFDNGNDQGMVTATVGNWYFLACSVNGTTVNTYVKPLGGSISNSSSATIAASGVTASQFWLGEWPDLGQWLNGCLAGVKLWLGAALTQTELDTEAGQLMPVRTANLTCAYPLDVAETTDHSGNGFTLTASGTPTTEASPTGIPLGTLGGGSGGGGTTATFGKTTDGGSQSTSSANRVWVIPATPASTGVVTTGHARLWLSAAGTTSVKFAIYADSAGAPGALLAESDAITLTATTEAERVFTFSGANLITVNSGTQYWIGAAWQDPDPSGSTISVTVSYAGSTGGRLEQSLTWPTLPNPYGTPVSTTGNGPIDVYVTYTVGGGSTGPEPGRRLLASL